MAYYCNKICIKIPLEIINSRNYRKVVGDAGFEPATSTVCRKHGKKKLKK